MAGIGFQLRQLGRGDSISSVLAAAGHAAVIAAGPWLFTIMSLASISLATDRVAGLVELAQFRLIIIYAFAVSLVLTAPITIVATRRVADALWLRRPEDVRPLLIGALSVALPTVGIGTGLLLAVMQPPLAVAIVLIALAMLVGLCWVVLAFCGAVRDYVGVTVSFLLGLIVSVAASIGAAIAGYDSAGMALGFLLGLAITFFGMTSRVLATFPQPLRSVLAGIMSIVSGLSVYWPLAVGALAAAIGVWIDKWVFWLSSSGERVPAGLLHAPLYDSAMFIASLVIIPSLAAFVTRLETNFFERYQQYYATIASHGTIGQIEGARRRLHLFTLDNLSLVTLAQVGMCAILILSAPMIIDALGLQYRQIAILRFGALGAVFQFIFIASTSMLLFFDRRRPYMLLQLLFMGLMGTCTVATLYLGDNYHGVGYFIACVASSFVAFRVVDATFRELNYLTFIGNNPTIVTSSAPRSWRASHGGTR